jgi:hypothetical protein
MDAKPATQTVGEAVESTTTADAGAGGDASPKTDTAADLSVAEKENVEGASLNTLVSKNQLKRLARKKLHEETREAWKAQRKKKQKARKARKRQESSQGRKLDGDGDGNGYEQVVASAGKRQKVELVLQKRYIVEDIQLIIDCAFDDLMSEKVCAQMTGKKF